MNQSQAEKHVLEREAVEWFLGHYNEYTGKKFRLVSQQERPDALLEDEQGIRLGLEIAHLYYDSLEAKMLLGRSSTGEMHGAETLSQLIDKLNWLITKKFRVGRFYEQTYPISLLIRSASPIFSGPDLDRVRTAVRVPKGVYQEVWLLACDEQIPGWPHLISLRD